MVSQTLQKKTYGRHVALQMQVLRRPRGRILLTRLHLHPAALAPSARPPSAAQPGDVMWCAGFCWCLLASVRMSEAGLTLGRREVNVAYPDVGRRSEAGWLVSVVIKLLSCRLSQMAAPPWARFCWWLFPSTARPRGICFWFFTILPWLALNKLAEALVPPTGTMGDIKRTQFLIFSASLCFYLAFSISLLTKGMLTLS